MKPTHRVLAVAVATIACAISGATDAKANVLLKGTLGYIEVEEHPQPDATTCSGNICSSHTVPYTMDLVGFFYPVGHVILIYVHDLSTSAWYAYEPTATNMGYLGGGFTQPTPLQYCNGSGYQISVFDLTSGVGHDLLTVSGCTAFD